MNIDLTEENKALTALIKSVEDKVAAAGYVPGVCVKRGGDKIGTKIFYKIVEVIIRNEHWEIWVEFLVKEQLNDSWASDNDTRIVHSSRLEIVPNPEEQDT